MLCNGQHLGSCHGIRGGLILFYVRFNRLIRERFSLGCRRLAGGRIGRLFGRGLLRLGFSFAFQGLGTLPCALLVGGGLQVGGKTLVIA